MPLQSVGCRQTAQHRIGTVSTLHGDEGTVIGHGRLSGIERTQCCQRIGASPDRRTLRNIRRMRAQNSDWRDQFGRSFVRAHNLQTLAFEEVDHEAQDRIVSPSQQPQQHRQARPKAEIGADRRQVRSPHAADDHQFAATTTSECADHRSDAAQIHPGVGKSLDAAFGFTGDSDDMHAPAPRRHGRCNFAGHARTTG